MSNPMENLNVQGQAMASLDTASKSSFPDGINKEQMYKQVLEQCESLFEDQKNWVSNTANTASLLWHAFKALPDNSPAHHVNWVGFYVYPDLLSASSSTIEGPKNLMLGPFQGKVACQNIPTGMGVVGSAVARGETTKVPDVTKFAGHISCDPITKSEIVVPITKQDNIVGVIDIDCAVLNAFEQIDEDKLEELADLLAESCEWPF